MFNAFYDDIDIISLTEKFVKLENRTQSYLSHDLAECLKRGTPFYYKIS